MKRRTGKRIKYWLENALAVGGIAFFIGAVLYQMWVR